MAKIKQLLLDQLESRGELDDDEMEPYTPPSPAYQLKEKEDDAEVSSDL